MSRTATTTEGDTTDALLRAIVKPLVWVDFDSEDIHQRATASGEEYSVGFEDGSWFAYSDTRCRDVKAGLPTLAAAQAAAESDYRARLAAALNLKPVVAVIYRAQEVLAADERGQGVGCPDAMARLSDALARLLPATGHDGGAT
jgi:hypothetical protein